MVRATSQSNKILTFYDRLWQEHGESELKKTSPGRNFEKSVKGKTGV